MLYSCGGQRIWTVHSMSYLKFTLHIMPETEKVGDVGADQSKSHEVLIDKEKLSDTHHVAGQTQLRYLTAIQTIGFGRWAPAAEFANKNGTGKSVTEFTGIRGGISSRMLHIGRKILV